MEWEEDERSVADILKDPHQGERLCRKLWTKSVGYIEFLEYKDGEWRYPYSNMIYSSPNTMKSWRDLLVWTKDIDKMQKALYQR